MDALGATLTTAFVMLMIALGLVDWRIPLYLIAGFILLVGLMLGLYAAFRLMGLQ